MERDGYLAYCETYSRLAPNDPVTGRPNSVAPSSGLGKVLCTDSDRF